MAALSVQYKLNPPAGTAAPALEPNAHHTIPVLAPPSGDHRSYYDALRASIADAKATLGEELTAWRDAVGKGEAIKEKKQVSTDSEEEEEEVDDRDS